MPAFSKTCHGQKQKLHTNGVGHLAILLYIVILIVYIYIYIICICIICIISDLLSLTELTYYDLRNGIWNNG